MTGDPTPLFDIVRERPARRDVWFDSGGDRCAAWLYPAAGDEPRPPLVILAHGLGGTRHMRLDSYARRFADAGYAALVFDYRGFGDSEGVPRQVVGVRAQLEDWHAALAYARSELEVDTERIALWGTSFGGGHVLRVAADDGNVRAVVAQCPFTDGTASVLRRFVTAPPSAVVLFAAALVDVVGSWFKRKPVLAPMAGTAWMPAYLAAKDSLPGAASQAARGTVLSRRTSRMIERFPSLRRHIGNDLLLSEHAVPKSSDSIWGTLITPDGGVIQNAIAARLAATLALYRPGRALRRTGDTPILICACDNDTVAPVGPTVRAAAGRPNVQVNRYPYGHFEIYVGDAFRHAIADQLDFLERVLAPRAAARHEAPRG